MLREVYRDTPVLLSRNFWGQGLWGEQRTREEDWCTPKRFLSWLLKFREQYMYWTTLVHVMRSLSACQSCVNNMNSIDRAGPAPVWHSQLPSRLHWNFACSSPWGSRGCSFRAQSEWWTLTLLLLSLFPGNFSWSMLLKWCTPRPITAQGRVRTPKHFMLPLTVNDKHLTRSSQLLTMLNRLGHGYSYSAGPPG